MIRVELFIELTLALLLDTTSLNRSTARDQAGITIHRSPIKPTKGRRRSPSSSSSSSSESRRDPSRSLIVASGSTRSTTRLSSKQVIADLSRELERVRRDGESLLRERDDQVVSLMLAQPIEADWLATDYRLTDYNTSDNSEKRSSRTFTFHSILYLASAEQSRSIRRQIFWYPRRRHRARNRSKSNLVDQRD